MVETEGGRVSCEVQGRGQTGVRVVVKRKVDKETWWWNEELQERRRRKRLEKQNDEKSRQENKEMQQQVKRDVAKAKEKAYEELDTKRGEKDLKRLARKRNRVGKDVLQVRAIKDGDGNVLTGEESVIESEREREKETKWKGSKARNIGGGFKLFYHGVDGKRNGVGVILKEEYSKSVVEVKRVSGRVMNVKLEVEGMMINVISAYAPQVGCEMKEQERFSSELDDVVGGVPRKERLVIGADFNGHERNVEGQMVVDFAKRMEMAVVNTYFKKKEDHRVTYKSGGRCTQVDYVLCRRCNLKEIGDCKVLAGDSVARQHRMVVCRMVLEVKKKRRRRERTKRRIRWWKLKEEECSVRFSEEVRQELGGSKEVLDNWETTAGVMREAAST
ncbi:hypothetical protein C0J45_16063 [Silurus meridionalis]|nr:hypothetical protein C0J45_16063 [Silurus meridionalis]